MYGIMKMSMLFIGSNIIIVASMSVFHSNKNSSQLTEPDYSLPIRRYAQQHLEPLERTRRLIPYMTFYIPTTNGDYLPYGPITKQMNPYLYQEAATLPSSNQNTPNLYVPVTGAVIRKPLPSSRLPPYNDDVDDGKIPLKSPHQPQKVATKNVYVTPLPLVDVVIPQHSYQLNSDAHNNEAAVAPMHSPSAYLNDHRGSNLTPFLPSNQVPGPFRPILSTPRNYTTAQQYQSTIDSPNNIRYSAVNNILKESVPIALTNPSQLSSEAYYVASTSTTERPIVNNEYDATNGIEDSIQQVYVLEPIVKPEITRQKATLKPDYVQLQSQQQPSHQPQIVHAHPHSHPRPHKYKSYPKNVAQRVKVPSSTKINYDLDPDDGYGGRVLLPYESYYTKDFKSSSQIQSTVEPSYLPKPTLKPVKSVYESKLKPVNTFESVSYDPYEIAVTTHDTHQHLTETTPIQPHQNHSTIEIQPFAYDNYISTTSSKPLTEILQNMNRTSLQLLLTKLKENNYLPKSFTMNKLDNSLRTLAKVLVDLKKSHKLNKVPPFSTTPITQRPTKIPTVKPHFEGVSSYTPLKSEVPGPQSGEPGVDYPNLSVIPKTQFNCSEQRYKGFFGDPETGCQVWHYCDLNGGQASFLCPNGTIFSQVLLTCDWWFNVKCSSTAQLYVLNERLYKYILPLNPKFPEDYSGPLVDKYLAIKFQEMEDKLQRERNRNRVSNESNENTTGDNDENDDNDQMDTSTEGTTEDILPMTADDSFEMDGPSTEEPLIITEDTERNMLDHPTKKYYYQTTTLIPSVLPPLPPPPKFSVESERAEVIEIRSDGSSGHLTPGRT